MKTLEFNLNSGVFLLELNVMECKRIKENKVVKRAIAFTVIGFILLGLIVPVIAV